MDFRPRLEQPIPPPPGRIVGTAGGPGRASPHRVLGTARDWEPIRWGGLPPTPLPNGPAFRVSSPVSAPRADFLHAGVEHSFC